MMKTHRMPWAAGLLAAALLALPACSRAREEAAMAISTAKVHIARAKEMRADRWAPSLLASAESKLKTAEQNFSKGTYGYAKTQALNASDYATQAAEQAEMKKAKTQPGKKELGNKSKKKPAKIRKKQAV